MGGDVKLEAIGGHLVHVPVRVDGSEETRFIFDTGVGLDLVSNALLARAGGRLTGETYSGRRMSGQLLEVPLARVPSLSLGALRHDDALVGVFDFALPPELQRIEGFLAPTFFGKTPFTLGRTAGTLVWGDEGPSDLPAALGPGAPLDARWDGPAVTLFVDLELPDGWNATVEVDTGSSNLILDARFMTALGVRDGDPGVRRNEGTDETGNAYTRYLATVRGRVAVRGVPGVAQRDPVVMFQKIIYDGLLGDEFLRPYDVTFDLGRSRIYFAPARS